MDITDLKLLLAAAEAGSFRRAAADRGLDVATLSRRIARLEDELGVVLFERGRAGAKLTVAGSSTVSLARKALTTFEEIRRTAAANGRAEVGRLRLGTHLSTVGPQLRGHLRAWRRLHPIVMLDLTEADDRALLVGLRERELDAIIAFFPVVPSSLAYQDLWTEPLLLALPSAHPLAAQDRLGWKDVRSLPILVRTGAGSNSYHEFQADLVGPGADFHPIAAGTFNLLNLVAMGEGAMFVLNYHREMAVDGVVLRPIEEADASITVVLAWDPAIEDPVTGNFVAFMRDRAKLPSPRPDAAWQSPGPFP